MHEHCTTKMRKCWCMKFLCIISGCPAGARKWHISCFAMLLHSKNRGSTNWGAFLCCADTPCLSLWERWLSGAKTERGD